jgi:hypothetical protein
MGLSVVRRLRIAPAFISPVSYLFCMNIDATNAAIRREVNEDALAPLFSLSCSVRPPILEFRHFFYCGEA